MTVAQKLKSEGESDPPRVKTEAQQSDWNSWKVANCGQSQGGALGHWTEVLVHFSSPQPVTQPAARDKTKEIVKIDRMPCYHHDTTTTSDVSSYYQCDVQSDCLIFHLPTCCLRALPLRRGHFWGQLETQTERSYLYINFSSTVAGCSANTPGEHVGLFCDDCRAPQIQPPVLHPTTDRPRKVVKVVTISWVFQRRSRCWATAPPLHIPATQPMNAYRISCEGGWYINT